MIPGTDSFAILWIFAASSGVHIEAENCTIEISSCDLVILARPKDRFERICIGDEHTRKSGFSFSHIAFTSSMPTSKIGISLNIHALFQFLARTTGSLKRHKSEMYRK